MTDVEMPPESGDLGERELRLDAGELGERWPGLSVSIRRVRVPAVWPKKVFPFGMHRDHSAVVCVNQRPPHTELGDGLGHSEPPGGVSGVELQPDHTRVHFAMGADNLPYLSGIRRETGVHVVA